LLNCSVDAAAVAYC